MNKKFKFILKDILWIVVIIAAALIFIVFTPVTHKEFILTGVFAIGMIAVLCMNAAKNNSFDVAAHVISSKEEKLDEYVKSISIPSVVVDEKGRIIWYNPPFYSVAGPYIDGKKIQNIIPDISIPEKDKRIKIAEKKYIKEQFDVELKNKKYRLIRFIDDEKCIRASELYRTVLTVVAHMQIDNYDELMRSLPKEEHSYISVNVENIIAKSMEGINGFFQQYDEDKYIMLFERKALAVFMENKFELIDKVKQIRTKSNGVPTISMGVGVGANLKESNNSALAALDLALGRGGDQAVIKEKQGYKFYGSGLRVTEKRAKVRSRIFASALRNLMEQCDNIVIMGHTVPDLDCVGAALGISACARYVGKKPKIVLEKSNASVRTLIEEVKTVPEYADCFINGTEAEKMLESDRSMLVIVDTQIKTYTSTPYLVDKAKTIVIIDHHLKGTAWIDNAAITFLETNASSASEMAVETIQYFSEKIKLLPIEAQGLLAGIIIDTKGFTFKTGVRTFEAASYLKTAGADTISVRHLYQDDIDTFNSRAEVVKNAAIIKDIAIGKCPDDAKSPQLLAAQAADSLIGIRGINASFVLCRADGRTIISGRSLGSINVQRILEKLGGGGHSTIAGAQLNCDMMNAALKLETAIYQYLKEK